MLSVLLLLSHMPTVKIINYVGFASKIFFVHTENKAMDIENKMFNENGYA